jgi:hydrogenase maturation protease
MSNILILGYGNPDREDDGVAWHILKRLAPRFGYTQPADLAEGYLPAGKLVDLFTALQLTPEMAEVISGYDRVCFVDAHTGNIPEDIAVKEVVQGFQASPFTHHMTPATCLSLAHTLHGKAPQAILVSIRGYQYEFSQQLSQKTEEMAGKAAEIIIKWIGS